MGAAQEYELEKTSLLHANNKSEWEGEVVLDLCWPLVLDGEPFTCAVTIARWKGRFMGTSTDLDATTTEYWKNVTLQLLLWKDRAETWILALFDWGTVLSSFRAVLHLPLFFLLLNPLPAWHCSSASQSTTQQGWLECSFWKNSFECQIPKEGPKKEEPQV